MKTSKHLLLLLLAGSACFVSAVSGSCPANPDGKTAPGAKDGMYDESMLDTVLTALEKALDFMWKEVKRLNLDAIIGTRILEAQMDTLLPRLTSNASDVGDGRLVASAVARQRIDAIRRAAGHVSDQATPFIKKHQKEYYDKISPVIGRDLWKINYKSRDLHLERAVPPRFSGEALHEADSDNCLTELFGTSVPTKEKCHVTKQCWNMMTAPGYRYYSLTHECFYLEIGKAYGCFGDVMRPLTDELNEGFCSNVLLEAEEIAKDGFPVIRRDLFTEQAALCGMLGYRQFFRADWLKKILSWQRPSRGCWSLDGPLADFSGSRFKREERVLDDGCRCHFTSVAVAALAQYVRYVIEGCGQLPTTTPEILL